MCRIDGSGEVYVEATGRTVTPSDLDSLSKKEVDELNGAAMTKLGYLQLRKSLHDFGDGVASSLSEIKTMLLEYQAQNEKQHKTIVEQNQDARERYDIELREIRERLTVTVSNGERKEKAVSDLIVEIYEYTRAQRWRNRLKKVLKQSAVIDTFAKKVILALTGTISLLLIKFRDEIIELINRIF